MTARPIRIAFVLAFAALGCNRAPEEPAPVRPEPAASPQISTTPECSRDALTRLISMPEDLPTQKEVLAVCSQPRPMLIAIARDQSGRGLARLRAIEMLGTLGGSDAVAPLAELSLATTDLASVRRASLVALGRVTQPADAERERVGASALGDPDPHVRRAAAVLLRGSKSDATRQALDRAFAAETVPFVRDEIDQSRKH
jgi:HEAT repeat protein